MPTATTVERSNGRVIKRVSRWLEYGVFEREVRYLAELQYSGFTPKVFSVSIDRKEIEMEDCGQDATQATMPPNAFGQAVEILYTLNKLRIRHNDIRPQNVTVRDGKLFLIDWQWATRGSAPDVAWPKGLGTKYRAGWPDWRFDDAVSFMRVLEGFR